MLLLKTEQKLFGFEAVGVADGFAVCADNAVAGDDDRKRVLVVGAANCAAGARVAQACGYVPVADGGAVGDCLQGFPNLLLEWCACGR